MSSASLQDFLFMSKYFSVKKKINNKSKIIKKPILLEAFFRLFYEAVIDGGPTRKLYIVV